MPQPPQHTNTKRVFGYLCDGEIEIASYTEDQHDNVKAALYKILYPYECLCKITGLNKPENELGRIELTKLCFQLIERGVSLLARDVKTNKVVGFSINTTHSLLKPGEKSHVEIFNDEECKSESGKGFMDSIVYFDIMVDFFKLYNTKNVFEIMFLATDPDYGKRSIARVLCEYSIQLAKEIKNDESTLNKPTIVSSLFTSPFSQRIGQKLNFTTIVRISFDDCKYKGKTYTELLADTMHNSIHYTAIEI